MNAQKPKNRNHPSPLKKPLLASAAVHTVVTLLFILFPPGGRLTPQPPLNVTWVELPKGTSEDIYGLHEVKKLPETTIEEQKTPTPPEEKKIPETEPAVKKEEPKAADEKAMKEPEKKTAKPLPQPVKTPPKKSGMDQALAKIDKKLKERQSAPPEAAQTPSGGGYKYGTGNEPVRVPTDDPEFLKYQALVRAKIFGQWVVPSAVNELPPDRVPVVRIVVLIGKGGDVIAQHWAKKSEIEVLNASVMRAIERASPFPIPPERLKWEAYNEGFLVEFKPRKR